MARVSTEGKVRTTVSRTIGRPQTQRDGLLQPRKLHRMSPLALLVLCLCAKRFTGTRRVKSRNISTLLLSDFCKDASLVLVASGCILWSQAMQGALLGELLSRNLWSKTFTTLQLL